MSEISQDSPGETQQEERIHQVWLPPENVIWLHLGFSAR
jgi:hypothetical protein